MLITSWLTLFFFIDEIKLRSMSMKATCLDRMNALNSTVSESTGLLLEVSRQKLEYREFAKNALLITSMVLILACSIGGNVIIWLVIPFQKTLKSPMNLLLLNLSLGHLIGSVFLLVFLFIVDVGEYQTSQYARDILCAITEGLGGYFLSCGAYLLTLCGIGFNRYMAIKYPTKQNLRMTKKSVLIYNIMCWFFSFVWILPSLISFQYEPRTGICLRNWRGIHALSYRITSWLWSIMLPLVFLLLSFTGIVLRRKENNLMLDGTAISGRKLRLQKAEKLLGLLILTFLFTWSPFFVYWGLYTMTSMFVGCSGEFLAMKVMRITLLFSGLNGLIDPILYTVGSSAIRKSMYLLFSRALCDYSINRIHPATVAATIDIRPKFSPPPTS